MKVSAIALVTLLALASAVTAHAAAQLRTGTVFEIAQQYANGGKFAGVTSGTTGTALEVARDSMNFLGATDRVASAWPAPRILAQGD
jgi:hypothetical protein